MMLKKTDLLTYEEIIGKIIPNRDYYFDFLVANLNSNNDFQLIVKIIDSKTQKVFYTLCTMDFLLKQHCDLQEINKRLYLYIKQKMEVHQCDYNTIKKMFPKIVKLKYEIKCQLCQK